MACKGAANTRIVWHAGPCCNMHSPWRIRIYLGPESREPLSPWDPSGSVTAHVMHRPVTINCSQPMAKVKHTRQACIHQTSLPVKAGFLFTLHDDYLQDANFTTTMKLTDAAFVILTITAGE